MLSRPLASFIFIIVTQEWNGFSRLTLGLKCIESVFPYVSKYLCKLQPSSNLHAETQNSCNQHSHSTVTHEEQILSHQHTPKWHPGTPAVSWGSVIKGHYIKLRSVVMTTFISQQSWVDVWFSPLAMCDKLSETPTPTPTHRRKKDRDWW